MAVEVADAPDPVEAGGTLVYTVTVRNRGPNPSSSTHLIVEIPPGVPSQIDKACVRNDRTVFCELGELTARQTQTITLAVIVEGRAETVRLTADVSNRFGPDLHADDNTWTEATQVRRTMQ